MRMFLTKVWGWDVLEGPLQFSTSGWRDNALRKLPSIVRPRFVGKGQQSGVQVQHIAPEIKARFGPSGSAGPAPGARPAAPPQVCSEPILLEKSSAMSACPLR